MPAYDERHNSPPAPVADVTLRSHTPQATVANVPMLLDTGADVTLVPRVAVDRLGVTPIAGQQYELIGFDGNHSTASVVVLDLILSGKAFRGRYVLADDTVGIIGRDILNHLTVGFDGPALEWNIIQ